VWNDQQKIPYAYSNELLTSSSKSIEWVGFDDVKSIEYKVKMIKEMKLGGGMIWYKILKLRKITKKRKTSYMYLIKLE
jgi:GH18 family chitinase